MSTKKKKKPKFNDLWADSPYGYGDPETHRMRLQQRCDKFFTEVFNEYRCDADKQYRARDIYFQMIDHLNSAGSSARQLERYSTMDED